MRGVTRKVRGAGILLLLLLPAACAPGDPLPGPDTDPPGRAMDALLDDPRLQEIVAFQHAGDGEALIGLLDDPDPVVRARAAFALGSVRDTAALEALTRRIKDLDHRVRADAAFALGQLDLPGVATLLFDAFKAEWYAEAQRAQLVGIGQRCDERSAERLRSAVVPGLRGEVNLALSRCALAEVGGEAVWDHLAEELDHANPGARQGAAYAFGRFPDPGVWYRHRRTVRTALQDYAADDPAAPHLIRGLGRAQDRFAPPILAWWLRNGAQWQARTNAAEALGRFPGLGARGRLFPALDDPSVHVRLQAATALVANPPAPVEVAFLQEWLERNPSDVATAGPVLEILAAAGDAGSVVAWFSRQDMDREAVQLAGARGASALEGEVGVSLLGRIASTGETRAARAAALTLEDRWEISRNYPEAHAVFLEIFQDLVEHEDPVVRGVGARGLEDDASEAAEAPSPEEPPPHRVVDWEALSRLGPRPLLHLETNRGVVTLRLDPLQAPLTVDAMTRLAREGRFDGVPFHRVVPNFVVQGGDLSLGSSGERTDFRLRTEATRIPYHRGVVGMARTERRDTETSQFFITHSSQPHLDGGYTAFGWVVEGLEVAESLGPEDRILGTRVTPG